MPDLKDRRTANQAIAATVGLHLVNVLLASVLEWRWLTRFAATSSLGLYFIAGPLLWLWHRATQRTAQVETLNDIRDVFAAGESVFKYDPEQHFDEQRGLFTGLADGSLEPVYVPWSDYRKTHMQVLGSTGFGKGVATCMFLAQSLLAGECVVVADPKDDEFAPNVLNRYALRCGAPFYLIDLRPEAPSQINLFRGCTAHNIEEILNTAFDMGDKGNASDFYRLFDRKAARDVCRIATEAKRDPTVRDLAAATHQSTEITDEKGIKFQADLEELATLEAINAEQGHDLEHILAQNAVVYIVGSIRSVQTIRAQKMLLLRILQIIEKRDRSQKLRPIAMMLDELKYLLSPAVLQALGTVRDKSCHVMLAHQSNGDLEDCGGLDPNAVRGAVIVNTGLKLIYRASDPDTLQWASDLSGTIVAQQRSSHMQQGMFSAAEGQYRDQERNWITKNQILAMAKQTGMFYGAGMARVVKVSVLPAGPRPTLQASAAAPKPTQETPLSNLIGSPEPSHAEPADQSHLQTLPEPVQTDSNSVQTDSNAAEAQTTSTTDEPAQDQHHTATTPEEYF